MSDQPDADTSTWQNTALARDMSMPPTGFEPAIPASDGPQTHDLDRAVPGIGNFVFMCKWIGVESLSSLVLKPTADEGNKRTQNPAGMKKENIGLKP